MGLFFFISLDYVSDLRPGAVRVWFAVAKAALGLITPLTRQALLINRPGLLAWSVFKILAREKHQHIML